MSDNRKKILFVITKGVWGGAQKYVFDLSTSIKSEYDVAVAYGTPGRLPEKLEAEGIRSIHIPSLGRDVNPLLDIASFFKLVQIFHREKPDVVHLNSSKIGGLGALAARLMGIKKIIFTVHGWPFNEDRNSLSKLIIWNISWFTALLSTQLIVLGEKEKQQALKMPFVSAKKVHLISLGIAVPQFLDTHTARAAIAREVGKTESYFDLKTVVGTIAELTHNKGLSTAIEAIKDIPNAVYVIIGDGELKKTLTQQIKELGLEDRVILAGFFDNAQNYLKAFNIFLIASVKEGLPYTLLEAGYARLPVVATSVGAIPEVITNGEHGILVEPKHPEQIASALKKLIFDAALREQYAHNFSHLVQEQFTVQKIVEETQKLY